MLLTNRSKHDQPNKKMNISGYPGFSGTRNLTAINSGSKWSTNIGGGVAHLYVLVPMLKRVGFYFLNFCAKFWKESFFQFLFEKKQIVKKRSQTRDEGKHYLIDRFSGLINSKSTCHLPRAPSFHLIIWRRSLKTLTFIDSHSW